MRLLPQNTSNKVRPATIGISSSFCQFMTTLTRERSEEANANPIFGASGLLAGIETGEKAVRKTCFVEASFNIPGAFTITLKSLIFITVALKWAFHWHIDVISLSLRQFRNNAPKPANHVRSNFFV